MAGQVSVDVKPETAMTPGVPGTPSGEDMPPSRQSELDRSLVHSVAWTGAVKWSVQLFTWVSTFVVARLLMAEDYGLLAMAGVFVGFVTLVSEFGLSMTIVTMRDLGRVQLSQLNGLALLVGAAAMALAWASATPLAGFFDEPRLAPVVTVLSVTFLITSLKIVPSAVLQRELQFKTLALIEGFQGIVQAATTILLAWSGLRYWALVGGILAGNTTGVILVLLYRRHAFRWPRWRSLSHSLTFTRHQLSSNLAWYAYSSSDMLIAGKLLGPAGVGLYSFAHLLARSLPEKVTSLVVRVTPAFFSAVQDDVPALRRYVLRLTESLALITFPALVGLALVAEDLLALIGPQWTGAVNPLRILAIFAAYDSVLQLLSRALTATRETRFLMRNSIAMAVLMPCGFIVGSAWGPTGIAAAWLVIHPMARIPLMLRACNKLDMTLPRYFASYWPAVSGCLPMAGVVLLLDVFFGSVPPVGRILAFALAGSATYIATIFAFHGDKAGTLTRHLKSALARRPVPAA